MSWRKAPEIMYIPPPMVFVYSIKAYKRALMGTSIMTVITYIDPRWIKWLPEPGESIPHAQ